MPAGAASPPRGRHRIVSFLDPYEKNRRVSLITWLRILVWAILLGIAWLVWWLVT